MRSAPARQAAGLGQAGAALRCGALAWLVAASTAAIGADVADAGNAANVANFANRPTVGLVLGGGGARGMAHIGVLEVLEQLRVPVDCVAGTSMGALVAGAWAAGVDPQAMRREIARADWRDMFQDNPGLRGHQRPQQAPVAALCAGQ